MHIKGQAGLRQGVQTELELGHWLTPGNSLTAPPLPAGLMATSEFLQPQGHGALDIEEPQSGFQAPGCSPESSAVA